MNIVRTRRAAAMKAIQRFCRDNGFDMPHLRFERRPGRIIALIGAAPDGRELGIGYSAAR